MEPVVTRPPQVSFDERDATETRVPSPLWHPPLLIHPRKTTESPEQLLLLRRKTVSKMLHCQHVLNKRMYLPARHEKVAEKMPELARQVRTRHRRAPALLL